MNHERTGELALANDPANLPADASLVFIGRVRSPWTARENCPKNMAAARETGQPAVLEIDAPFRAGLDGIERFSHLAVLTWLDRARRDLIVQKPRHAETPRGIFALRSPVRPNPVGLHVVELLKVEHDTGRLHLSAIDVLDGTPILDVKPYYPSADAVPGAGTGRP